MTGVNVKYLIDHPTVLDVLPGKIELVILPENDSERNKFNLKLLR